MRGRIGDTIWVVQEDGSLQATYGDGDGAIHATAIGSAPGSRDGIAVRAVRWDRILLDARFGDMATAMEAVGDLVARELGDGDPDGADLNFDLDLDPASSGVGAAPALPAWRQALLAAVGCQVVGQDADDAWRMDDGLFWEVASGLLGEIAGREDLPEAARAWGRRVGTFAALKGRGVARISPGEFDGWCPLTGDDQLEALLPPEVTGAVRQVLMRVVLRLAALEMRVGAGEPMPGPLPPEVSVHRLRVAEAAEGRSTGDELVDRLYLPRRTAARASSAAEREAHRIYREWAGEPLDLSDPRAVAERLHWGMQRLIAGTATEGDRRAASRFLSLMWDEMHASGDLDVLPYPWENPADAEILADEGQDPRMVALVGWRDRVAENADLHRARLHLMETHQGIAESLLEAMEAGRPLAAYGAALDIASGILRWSSPSRADDGAGGGR